MSRAVTLGSFVGGLIVWTLGTAAAFGSAAAIYNRLVAPASTAQAMAGHPATPHGSG
jgi:hypothetical protein